MPSSSKKERNTKKVRADAETTKSEWTNEIHLLFFH